MMARFSIVFLSLASFSFASEITWGDVAVDGSLTIRSLDVPIAIARGVDNFFVADPMEAHDWTHVRTLNRSMAAHLGVKDVGSAKISAMEKNLVPIFGVMPKDDAGRLSNGTVRYALHRYFRQKRGWSVKGLEPAGGTWIKNMQVTPDVKDMSKYMMPTYLQDVLMRDTGAKSLDLKLLAVLAASIEHLVHVEMISMLYSVYATLELSTADQKSGIELDEILDAFMIVYAFGANMDVTTAYDIAKAKMHLEQNHLGWLKIQEFVRSVKDEVISSSGQSDSKLDFAQVLAITSRIGDEYVSWQGRDCKRAKQELLGQPKLQNGRVPMGDVSSSHADGYRSLFTETLEDLRMYGVVDDSVARDPNGELVVSNYINSQGMCLSTASFYTACCPNECEEILGKLESAVAGPASTAEQVADQLQSGAMASDQLLSDLQDIAQSDQGIVRLHGRPFAELMHRVYPLECPAPSTKKATNPKTPDEWMQEPDEQLQDIDDMMREISNVLARYTAMSVSAEHAQAEDEVQNGDDVVKITDVTPRQSDVSETARAAGRTFFYLALAASMLGFAATLGKSGLVATCGVTSEKKTQRSHNSHFCPALQEFV